jgi:hypothetical protein
MPPLRTDMTSRPRPTHPHPVPDTPASYNGPVTDEACLVGFMMMLFRGHQIENVDNPIATQPRSILDEKTKHFTEDPVHAKDRLLALLPAGTDR